MNVQINAHWGAIPHLARQGNALHLRIHSHASLLERIHNVLKAKVLKAGRIVVDKR
jgi:hypothetical protein